MSVCQDELFATLQADGTGAIDWAGTPEGGIGCIVSNCTAIPAEAHWPVTSITETAPGLERIQVRLCYRGGGTEVHCNVSIPISHPEAHRQTFTMVSLCLNGTRRVEAIWQTESAQTELLHTEG